MNAAFLHQHATVLSSGGEARCLQKRVRRVYCRVRKRDVEELGVREVEEHICEQAMVGGEGSSVFHKLLGPFLYTPEDSFVGDALGRMQSVISSINNTALHAQQQQHPQHSQHQHQQTPQLANAHAPGAASNDYLFFYHQIASDVRSPPDVLGAGDVLGVGAGSDHSTMNAAHGYYQALQYNPQSDSQPLSTISGSGPEDGGDGGGGGAGGGSSGAASGAGGPTAGGNGGGGGNAARSNTQHLGSGSGPSRRGASEFTPWPGTHLTANPQAYTSRPQHQHLRGQQQSSSALTSITGTPPTTATTTSPPNARGTAIATGKRNARGRCRGQPATVRKRQKCVDDRDALQYGGGGVGGGEGGMGSGGRGLEVFEDDSNSDDSEYGDVPYGSYGSNTTRNATSGRLVGDEWATSGRRVGDE
ncbi:hypothetical protein BD410DRAFT_846777 [Rickenella mellea]|uniref:Uncharacterized protein n=1 Tax=Rickenella mellea TaxID=50990 RepID=A0A4Y7PE65_9AGAM|nr:hypothetical protein BD410DRAFT_846777 [Rickenella mellea]